MKRPLTSMLNQNLKTINTRFENDIEELPAIIEGSEEVSADNIEESPAIIEGSEEVSADNESVEVFLFTRNPHQKLSHLDSTLYPHNNNSLKPGLLDISKSSASLRNPFIADDPQELSQLDPMLSQHIEHSNNFNLLFQSTTDIASYKTDLTPLQPRTKLVQENLVNRDLTINKEELTKLSKEITQVCQPNDSSVKTEQSQSNKEPSSTNSDSSSFVKTQEYKRSRSSSPILF